VDAGPWFCFWIVHNTLTVRSARNKQSSSILSFHLYSMIRSSLRSPPLAVISRSFRDNMLVRIPLSSCLVTSFGLHC
jgi:hypothetical protein